MHQACTCRVEEMTLIPFVPLLFLLQATHATCDAYGIRIQHETLPADRSLRLYLATGEEVMTQHLAAPGGGKS